MRFDTKQSRLISRGCTGISHLTHIVADLIQSWQKKCPQFVSLTGDIGLNPLHKKILICNQCYKSNRDIAANIYKMFIEAILAE